MSIWHEDLRAFQRTSRSYFMNDLSEYGIFPKIVAEKNETHIACLPLCTVSLR